VSTATKKKLYDIAERAAWTFVQTFLAVVIAGQIWASVDKVADAKKAAAAALAAAFSVVKGLVATKFGNTDTASSLPAAADPAS